MQHIEFLIKRTDGEWFSLHRDRFADVLHPRSLPSTAISGPGDYRITLPQGQISFAFEEPGLIVTFSDFPGSSEEAFKIVEEVVENITILTGERGSIERL